MGRRCSAFFLKHIGSCLPFPFGSERLSRVDAPVTQSDADMPVSPGLRGRGWCSPPLAVCVLVFNMSGRSDSREDRTVLVVASVSLSPRPRFDAADVSRSMLGDSPSSRSSGKIWCLRTSAQNYHRPTSVPGEAGSAWWGGIPLCWLSLQRGHLPYPPAPDTAAHPSPAQGPMCLLPHRAPAWD